MPNNNNNETNSSSARITIMESSGTGHANRDTPHLSAFETSSIATTPHISSSSASTSNHNREGGAAVSPTSNGGGSTTRKGSVIYSHALAASGSGAGVGGTGPSTGGSLRIVSDGGGSPALGLEVPVASLGVLIGVVAFVLPFSGGDAPGLVGIITAAMALAEAFVITFLFIRVRVFQEKLRVLLDARETLKSSVGGSLHMASSASGIRGVSPPLQTIPSTATSAPLLPPLRAPDDALTSESSAHGQQDSSHHSHNPIHRASQSSSSPRDDSGGGGGGVVGAASTPPHFSADMTCSTTGRASRRTTQLTQSISEGEGEIEGRPTVHRAPHVPSEASAVSQRNSENELHDTASDFSDREGGPPVVVPTSVVAAPNFNGSALTNPAVSATPTPVLSDDGVASTGALSALAILSQRGITLDEDDDDANNNNGNDGDDEDEGDGPCLFQLAQFGDSSGGQDAFPALMVAVAVKDELMRDNLVAVLENLGVDTTIVTAPLEVEQRGADVLFIDDDYVELARTIRHQETAGGDYPMPVFALESRSASSLVLGANVANAGVTAYMTRGVSSESVLQLLEQHTRYSGSARANSVFSAGSGGNTTANHRTTTSSNGSNPRSTNTNNNNNSKNRQRTCDDLFQRVELTSEDLASFRM
eukprot:PhM_4_TR16167/c1_g1_i1/m.24633